MLFLDLDICGMDPADNLASSYPLGHSGMPFIYQSH